MDGRRASARRVRLHAIARRHVRPRRVAHAAQPPTAHRPPPTAYNLTMPDLSTYRAEFPILSRSVYMISNSLGAMPRRTSGDRSPITPTPGRRAACARGKSAGGTMGPRSATQIGRIIGAPAGSVSMHENVTTAHAVALVVPARPGGRRRIVCCARRFPVDDLPATRAAGARVRADDRSGGSGLYGQTRAGSSMRSTRRTAIVAISHVLFRSSFIVDPRPIIERAHAVGAQVVLDTYQSAGIIPVDVTALGVDFATGGCLKWLCGGPGNAFLYTRPDLLRTRAAAAHRLVLAHRAVRVRHRCVRAAATMRVRMMNGTPSIPAWYAALPGLRIMERGRDRPACARRSQALTGRVLDARGSARVPHRSPRATRRSWPARSQWTSPTRCWSPAPSTPATSSSTTGRGVGIRISPHFYNTEDEVDRLMAELARIVATKDYDPGATAPTIVT